jgi:hypothetical protein
MDAGKCLVNGGIRVKDVTLESTVSDGIAIGVEPWLLNSKVRIPCLGDDVFRRDRLTELIERATCSDRPEPPA